MYKITATYGGVSTVIHGRLDPNARVSGGKLTEQINTIPTFSFTIYPNNPGYDMIESMKTLIEVYDRKTDELLFRGRVYSVSDIMTPDGMTYKTVTCEGELAYLCDTVQPKRSYSGSPYLLVSAIPEILAAHNSKLPGTDKDIEAGRIVGGITEFTGEYMNTFDMIKKLCEDSTEDAKLSLEFRLVYRNGRRELDVQPQFGQRSSTVIRLGRNLKSLQRTTEAKDIVSRIYPYGAQHPVSGARLGISGGYVENAEIKSRYGIIEAVRIYDSIEPDDGTDNPWQHSAAVAAAQSRLVTAAERELMTMVSATKSFTINALDLSLISGSYDDLRLYNTYRVVTELQGIDEEVRITGRVLSLDEPQNPQLTFGVKQQTLTSMIAGR